MENNTSLTYSESNAPSITGQFPLLLKVIYAIIGTAGIIGNGIVLVVFGRQRFLWNVTSLFFFNQSVADLLASVLLILNFLLPPVEFSPQFSMREFLVCAFWSSRFFYWACLKVSTMNILILTLDRYVAVVFPLKYRRQRKCKLSVIVLVFAWFFSFAFQACWLVIQRLDNGKCVFVWPGHGAQLAYGLAVFFSLFIIPLVLMIFVYCSISKALSMRVGAGNELAFDNRRDHGLAPPAPPEAGQDRRAFASTPSPVGAHDLVIQNRQDVHHGARPEVLAHNYRDARQRDVIRTLIIVCSVYAFSWCPNQLLFLYSNLGGKVDFLSWYYHVTVCLAFMNIAVNPFIYTLKYAKFQRGFAKTFNVNHCISKPDEG